MKFSFAALALSLGLLGANVYAADNAQQEAASFFEKLSQSSNNPVISAMAQDNVKKLSGQSAYTKAANHNSASSRQYTVPLLTQSNSASLAVPAMINAKTMGTFIVDTGATYTVITPRMAKKLGVVITPETPRLSIVTANGVVKAPLVTVDSMTVGQVTVKNVQVIVQNIGNDIVLAGLLGMNFFKGMDLAVKSDRLIISVNN